MKKGWFERLLEWLGLIKYKTRTVKKTKIITIKRPENDCRLYKETDLEAIKRFKAMDPPKTDKEIGKILGRTEAAIRTERWRQRNGA